MWFSVGFHWLIVGKLANKQMSVFFLTSCGASTQRLWYSSAECMLFRCPYTMTGEGHVSQGLIAVLACTFFVMLVWDSVVEIFYWHFQ